MTIVTHCILSTVRQQMVEPVQTWLANPSLVLAHDWPLLSTQPLLLRPHPLPSPPDLFALLSTVPGSRAWPEFLLSGKCTKSAHFLLSSDLRLAHPRPELAQSSSCLLCQLPLEKASQLCLSASQSPLSRFFDSTSLAGGSVCKEMQTDTGQSLAQKP